MHGNNNTEESFMSTRDKLECDMEPNEPMQTILEVLKENNGKLLTKKIVDKIKDRIDCDSLAISRLYGMTHIVWHGSSEIGQRKDFYQILLSYNEKNVYIDSNFVEEKNGWCFRAREQRNKKRKELLDSTFPERLDEAILSVKNAASQLKKLLQSDDELYTVLNGVDLNDLCGF